jgi:glycosyltransferase involved in cell wall biosynthesis
MRIVIDLQGAQCGSRHRGIGRYSLALAQAMVRNRGDHDILIALNGLFPESIEPIREAFAGLCPPGKILVWHAQGPVHAIDPENTWRRHTAEFVREAFLASLKPDIVHVSSLLEGFSDDAVHSIGLLNASVPTAVTFYDLIPLIQSEQYLTPYPVFEALYREKLGHLSRADLYLAISESSRLELIEYLNVKDAQTVNISAAADACFKPVDLSYRKVCVLKERFGLPRPFLMCSGATDERKNHLRLIKAFSLLPIDLRNNYQLAIVGGLSLEHQKKFEAYALQCGLSSKDIVITGRVTDEEMTALYNLCALFVFPSWHEGFGLPALEAMSCGAAVIGANTTSLPEVIGRDDALFDPFNALSIAKKMEQILIDKKLRQDLIRHGLQRAKQFSWDESARRAFDAFEAWYEARIKANDLGVDTRSAPATWLVESIAKFDSVSSEKIPAMKTKSSSDTSKSKKLIVRQLLSSLIIGILLLPMVLLGLFLIFSAAITGNATRARAGARGAYHFINASVFNGNAWETVASHAWRMRDKRWAKIFIWLTNQIQQDHCYRANKRGQPIVDLVTSKGLDC